MNTVSFVQVTFVHIRNISGVTDPILMKLYMKVPGKNKNRTVTTTFVQATFVPVTFVHIRNISAVTNPILMKL